MVEVLTLTDNVLGKRMRWIRDKQDLKQKKVAKSLNVSAYQLSRYESGHSKPDPELIAEIATYYNVTTDYLLGKTDRPDMTAEDEKSSLIEEMAKKYPDADIMFDNLAEMTVDQLREVDDFIKFKLQKKGD